MQIKVMHREQCFAAAGGYGQEYNTENITIPTMIISISCLDKTIPNRLEKYRRENKNIINVAYVQFDDIDSSETVNGETPMSESDAKTIVDAWDTDGDKEVFDSLPQEVVLPDYLTPSNYEGKEEFLDDVSDWLSDEYGFCHFGFDEPVEE